MSVFEDEVNWDLLQTLQPRPHPAINQGYVKRAKGIAANHGLPYLGELTQEHQAAHHLLDMIGVPGPLPTEGGSGHAADLDARVWRAVAGALKLYERLDRIATWHSRETAGGGMVGSFCVECGDKWPCDTRRMADGTYSDGDSDPDPMGGYRALDGSEGGEDG